MESDLKFKGTRDKLDILIEDYIKENRYAWTVDEIYEQYTQYRKGYYVSFTANKVIKNVIEPYYKTKH